MQNNRQMEFPHTLCISCALCNVSLDFIAHSSHQYCLPNHRISCFTVFFSNFGTLFPFSKTNVPALKSLSVLVLSLEPRCPH